MDVKDSPSSVWGVIILYEEGRSTSLVLSKTKERFFIVKGAQVNLSICKWLGLYTGTRYQHRTENRFRKYRGIPVSILNGTFLSVFPEADMDETHTKFVQKLRSKSSNTARTVGHDSLKKKLT